MLHISVIPSHEVAVWLLVHIHHFLDAIGLKKDHLTEEIIYVAIIVGVALLLGWLTRTCVLWVVKKIVASRGSDLGRRLIEHRVLTRCSSIIPPLVILALLPFAFTSDSVFRIVVLRGLLVYTVIVVTMAICTVTSFIWCRFDEERNSKNLPIRGILETVLGVIWIIAVIICVAIVVNRSPTTLLTGLGAFAAVLMLVFKDSILGLVAGLQLSQNDMLRVGDWIVVPSTQANGVVVDVTLTAVKVQNFDNTIITLPPYTLISGSFQNWRGMVESGCRRIANTVIIDTESVVDADDALVAKIGTEFPRLKPYLERLAKSGGAIYDPGVAVVNGTLFTNLGLFRAYLCQWLLDNPAIAPGQQILVNMLEPTAQGFPLQIYCFTATTAWTAYEAIRSAVMEHVAVSAAAFGLRLFSYPSGNDVTTVQFDSPAPEAHAPAPDSAKP